MRMRRCGPFPSIQRHPVRLEADFHVDGRARGPPEALDAKLTTYGRLTRGLLRDLLDLQTDVAPFYGMMAYHLGWRDSDLRPREARPGKNLRPSLCLLAGEALGADPERLAPFAAGIELLHNFSLIHDDIEDRSATRRGRPAVWTLWGEAQAINAGDGMLSLAHRAWLSSDLAEADPAAFVAILRSLEDAIVVLCEGQYLDIRGEGSLETTSTQYATMIGRKTAALIGEVAWVGARAAGMSRAVLDAARSFGIELGLAFQIRDDILGIWGDEGETGKSASSDIATRKMTLPIIVALECGPETARADLRACYAAPAQGDDDQRIRQLLDLCDAHGKAAGHEARHWDAAMRALEALPVTQEWRRMLQLFARSFIDRRS
jgi:geranylgeranyl diphosphate synthase type I